MLWLPQHLSRKDAQNIDFEVYKGNSYMEYKNWRNERSRKVWLLPNITAMKSLKPPDNAGGVAHMVERSLRMREVRGSIPASPRLLLPGPGRPRFGENKFEGTVSQGNGNLLSPKRGQLNYASGMERFPSRKYN